MAACPRSINEALRWTANVAIERRASSIGGGISLFWPAVRSGFQVSLPHIPSIPIEVAALPEALA